MDPEPCLSMGHIMPNIASASTEYLLWEVYTHAHLTVCKIKCEEIVYHRHQATRIEPFYSNNIERTPAQVVSSYSDTANEAAGPSN